MTNQQSEIEAIDHSYQEDHLHLVKYLVPNRIALVDEKHYNLLRE